MLYKKQVSLIAFCILASFLLYFFGVRIAPKTDAKNDDAPNAKMMETKQGENAPATTINFEQLTTNLKNKLSADTKDSLQVLEKKLTAATTESQRVDILEKLAQKWEAARYVEVSSYYYKQVAEADSSSKNWETAANKMGMAFRIADDSTMRVFLLENAISAYQTALAFDTSNMEVKTNLAACYLEGYPNEPSQIMQGVFMLRDVTAVDSINVPANFMLGRMAIVSGQFDKAIQRFERVVRQEPTNAEAYYLLADSYLAVGQKEKAIEALKNCKKLIKNPTFATEIDKYINKIIKS